MATPEGVKPENWELASKDASLGVGHLWTAVSCPAYATFEPADCICRPGFVKKPKTASTGDFLADHIIIIPVTTMVPGKMKEGSDV